MISTIRVIEDKQCQSLIEKKTEEYESTRVKDITQLITSDEAVSLMSVDTTDMKTVVKIEHLIKNVLQFIQEKNQAMFNLECKLICSKYAFQISDSKNKALQTEQESLKESQHSMKVKNFQNEHKIKPLVNKQKELEMDVFQLTTEKKMQQSKIQQQGKEIFSLASQCERLKRRLNSVNEDNYKHQHNLAILKDVLKIKEEESKQLYKERKTFIASIDRANFEAEQMKFQLEKHSEEDILTRTSVDNLSNMINVIRNDCQKVEEENRILNMEKSQMTQKVLALENDLEELEITCQIFKEEIEISEKENEDLRKTLKGRKQLQPISEEAHSVIPSEENLESDRQRKLLKKIEEEIDEHEMKEQSTKLEKKYEEMTSALDKSQQESTTLKDEKKKTMDENSKLKDAMKELEMQSEQAKKENEKLTCEINNLTHENDSIKEKDAKLKFLQEKCTNTVKKFKDLTLDHARQTVKAESLALKCQTLESELKEKEAQWKKSSSFRLQEIKTLNGQIHDQFVQLETLQKSNDSLVKQVQEKPDKTTLETLKMTLLVRQKHVSFLEKENQKLQKLYDVQKQRYGYYQNSIQSISNERIHYYENEIQILQNQIYMFTLEVQNSEIQRDLTKLKLNKSRLNDQNKLGNNQIFVYMSAFEIRNSRMSLLSQEDKENCSQITSKGERFMNPENVQRAGLQDLETFDKTNILQNENRQAIETANQNYDKTNMIHGNEMSKEMVDDEYELELNQEEPTDVNEENTAKEACLFYSEEEKSQLPGFIADAKPANYNLFTCCQGATEGVSNKKKELSKKKLVHQLFRS
ncbi:Schizosaccharomyces specific protein [Schizosaccharomyces osmophilus]|uniref:Schizosaccharomyces specific protein n=1 Tax=Schizosaccharomyces osmophilus TaxID=2545709 RepID=A0AAE9WGH4_9SCHI|nr:Schizosaccharomyces specific protein [Schizosaccharomyces osmophilus]WBW74757.1 Schizosaccharomyces specific protein [Schizosaccharomyces osmophilus]